jgi:hypothetical protein
MLIHNGGSIANIDVARFGLVSGVAQEMTTINYGADIDGNNLRLLITSTATGSNLKFKYRITSISLTT